MLVGVRAILVGRRPTSVLIRDIRLLMQDETNHNTIDGTSRNAYLFASKFFNSISLLIFPELKLQSIGDWMICRWMTRFENPSSRRPSLLAIVKDNVKSPSMRRSKDLKEVHHMPDKGRFTTIWMAMGCYPKLLETMFDIVAPETDTTRILLQLRKLLQWWETVHCQPSQLVPVSY